MRWWHGGGHNRQQSKEAHARHSLTVEHVLEKIEKNRIVVRHHRVPHLTFVDVLLDTAAVVDEVVALLDRVVDQRAVFVHFLRGRH